MKKRFVIVGASDRGISSYGKALAAKKNLPSETNSFGFGDDCADHDEICSVCELVGIYDINPGRAAYAAELLGCTAYDSFDAMLSSAKPDCVIVTSVDYSHSDYVVRALDAGCEVFCEKPMCITAEQCRSILEAEKRNGRKIGVCFNLRYQNTVIQIKKLIESGVLGEIYNVHFEWLLTKDYSCGHSGHGASYYRRWNAYMEKSGGLLLTKSTHHFDLVNWFIESRPSRVSAFGKLRHYGRNGEYRAVRCSECPHTEKCPYYYKITPRAQEMYADHEKYDGYMIDRCVFNEAIDIYDTMGLTVEYKNGVIMTYSESSAAMYEGFKLSVNGSEARMEVQSFSNGGLREGEAPDYIRIIRPGESNITVIDKAPFVPGDHGGADNALRRVLFLGEEPAHPSQKADSLDGSYSILIGAAANESIKTGKIIDIDEFIGDASLLERN